MWARNGKRGESALDTLSLAHLIDMAVVVGAGFAGLLAGVLVGLVRTCRMLKPITESCSRLHTQVEEIGRQQNDTSTHSASDSGEDSETKQDGHYVGSSSSKGEERPTFTSSQHIGSIDTNSAKSGSKSSEAVMNAILLRERARSGFVSDAMAPPLMPESTPRKRSKKSCRICSKIRGWVVGGE